MNDKDIPKKDSEPKGELYVGSTGDLAKRLAEAYASQSTEEGRRLYMLVGHSLREGNFKIGEKAKLSLKNTEPYLMRFPGVKGCFYLWIGGYFYEINHMHGVGQLKISRWRFLRGGMIQWGGRLTVCITRGILSGTLSLVSWLSSKMLRCLIESIKGPIELLRNKRAEEKIHSPKFEKIIDLALKKYRLSHTLKDGFSHYYLAHH